MSFNSSSEKTRKWIIRLFIICALAKLSCGASAKARTEEKYFDHSLAMRSDLVPHKLNVQPLTLDNIEEASNKVESDEHRYHRFSQTHGSKLRELLKRIRSKSFDNIEDSNSRRSSSSTEVNSKHNSAVPTAMPRRNFPPIFKTPMDQTNIPPDYDYSYEYYDDQDYTYRDYQNHGSASFASYETKEVGENFNSRKLPHSTQDRVDRKNSSASRSEVSASVNDSVAAATVDKLQRTKTSKTTESSPVVSDDDIQESDDSLRNEVLPSSSKQDETKPKKAFRQPPKFMLDLYNKFSKKGFAIPAADVVRSFMNLNKEAPRGSEIEVTDNKTRAHTLLFNVTSISTDEDIRSAELRLYTLVERDRYHYFGVNRKVSVYEVTSSGNSTEKSYFLLCTRIIYGRYSGWETFKVTSAIKRWVRTKEYLKAIEIWIETVFDYSGDFGELDIDISTQNNNEPLLVVFSNENKREQVAHNEILEMIAHEMSTKTAKEINESVPLLKLRMLLSQFPLQAKSHSVEKRAADEADDNDFEFDDEDDVNDKYQYMSDEPAPGTRDKKKRRPRRKMKGRHSCRRKPMNVKFADLNWDEWIIAPTDYNAFQCTGKCYFPLSDHLTPSKHAIVQTLLHTNYPRKASKACCVPTKLDPISILYVDEKGVITYKFRYDGMVVSQCGCR